MKPGDHISRYRIERPLGQGGMGVVYLAEDTRLHRPVALKFLPADSFTDHDKQRFLIEAQAAARIHHPNICPLHDIEEADGRVFLSMEYVEGETLANKVASRGRLSVEQAVDVARQIAQGLDKAHSLGIVHRDIKSRNVMVSTEGHVSILDFGVALLPGAERLTAAGQAVGTPSYMSPEQCTNQPVDHRTDIWSLGVVLFELLTGRLPFRRDHPAATAHAILHDPVPSLQDSCPEAPAGLRAVLERALAKNPEQRWRTAREFAEALREFSHGTPLAVAVEGATQTMTAAVGAAPLNPARRWVGIAAGILLVVLAGGYVYQSRKAAATAPPAIVSSQQEKLVAILPFETLGSEAETADVANGVVEILTAALTDFEQTDKRLAAIPSSEIRRRQIHSPAEARRIYGANLVVTGTAQPKNGKIQFALTLIDPERTRQLAARVFEYDPASAVSARNRAIDELAGLLSLRPGAAVAQSTGGNPATSDAYAAYLKGRGLLARYDVPANLDQAIVWLDRAVKADPNYALAHAALGEACWRKSRAAGDKALADRALLHGEKAVALDPGIALVHTSLAAIYTTRGREEDAVRELKRALEIAPGHAEATRELARVYAQMGRGAEAETAYQQAIAARPTDWYGYLLLGLHRYQNLEHYDDAITAFRQARDLTPDNELIYRNLGVVYFLKGDYAAAIDELQKSIKLKANAATYGTLGATYYLQHKYAEAIASVETAIDLDPKRYYFWGNLGLYCKWNRGSEGRSGPAFRKAVELGEKFLEVSPKDYDVIANLAHYRAQLGERDAALREVARIPASAVGPRANRIAAAYELTGNRARAIPLLANTLKNPASRHLIANDPELAGLWRDSRLQQSLASSRD